MGRVPTVWTIDHTCGHTRDQDLSRKRADQRAGYAAWLAKRDCWDCYKEKNKGTFERRQAEERVQELADAETYEQRSGLESLDGTEKQVEWARVIRVDVLSAVYEETVQDGQQDEDWFEDTILRPARMMATARWWIDNREMDTDAWPELLAAGAESTDANENVG